MEKKIGYAKFVKIFKIKNPKECIDPWVELRHDGVWIKQPPDDTFLTPGRKQVSSLNPTR